MHEVGVGHDTELNVSPAGSACWVQLAPESCVTKAEPEPVELLCPRTTQSDTLPQETLYRLMPTATAGVEMAHVCPPSVVTSISPPMGPPPQGSVSVPTATHTSAEAQETEVRMVASSCRPLDQVSPPFVVTRMVLPEL
jgi:hypothetical protein